jgi:hypothetical protein
MFICFEKYSSVINLDLFWKLFSYILPQNSGNFVCFPLRAIAPSAPRTTWAWLMGLGSVLADRGNIFISHCVSYYNLTEV